MALLGGSWVVISGVIRPLIWVISIVTLLITLLITTHEPSSKIPKRAQRLASHRSPSSPSAAGCRELWLGLRVFWVRGF